MGALKDSAPFFFFLFIFFLFYFSFFLSLPFLLLLLLYFAVGVGRVAMGAGELGARCIGKGGGAVGQHRQRGTAQRRVAEEQRAGAGGDHAGVVEQARAWLGARAGELGAGAVDGGAGQRAEAAHCVGRLLRRLGDVAQLLPLVHVHARRPRGAAAVRPHARRACFVVVFFIYLFKKKERKKRKTQASE